MKIALAQLNPTVGDIPGNLKSIRDCVTSARLQGADLVVFPELAITGYPPQDHLYNRSFIKHGVQAVGELASMAQDIAIVLGFVEPNPSSTGKPFFNSAALLRSGKVEAVYRKQLLPDYGVFDEARYFEPGTQALLFEICGQRLALTICEDLWNQPGSVPRLYAQQPLDELLRMEPDWVLNLSASPFHLGRPDERQALFEKVAQILGAGVVFCNQVGAQDDLIFDGCSQVLDAAGQIRVRLPSFEPAFAVLDLAKSASVTQAAAPRPEGAWLCDALVLGIRDYVRKCGADRVCLGLSGGVDSSVVAALAVRALGRAQVRALFLPSQFTSVASGEDARLLAQRLGLQLDEISIDPLVQGAHLALSGVLGGEPKGLTQENLQPRLRMTLLMALANHTHSLLLNTSNKTEIATGYATLYGDSAGALGVLGDLTKDQVYALAHWMNRAEPIIPARVLERAPSAELKPNQKDEDTLPPYEILDWVVRDAVEKDADESQLAAQGYSPSVLARFLRAYRSTEYKRRQGPPILRVSRRAFGRGRRLPISAHFP